MTNEAVVFDGPKSVVFEERPSPEPGPEQVAIETRRTLVSTGTELAILSGEAPPGSTWDELSSYPFEPGYNNVGVITKIGENVDDDLLDTRVATYNPHQRRVVADVEQCRPVPNGVSDEEAVFFTIAEIVMNGVRRGRVSWGETVAVYGLGLLGQFAARIAHFAGARPVIGIDISRSRLDFLPDEPGFFGLDPTTGDVSERVADVTDGRLADVVVEMTGNPDVIPTEFDLLRGQGRFVVLSSPTGPSTIDLHERCNAPSYEIIGAHNSSHPPRETPGTPWTQKRHAELYFDLVAERTIDPHPLASHSEPAENAPELYDLLLSDRSEAMGVVLEW
jgi:threonine dehydrogenase-like Zn-dependent dehydrogenase